MVSLGRVSDPAELAAVRGLVERHVQHTQSAVGKRVVGRWNEQSSLLVRVMPNDYRRVLDAQAKMRATGLLPEQAEMAAFEQNARDEARVGGN
jgi:glutamate synthase (ferredoxin)